MQDDYFCSASGAKRHHAITRDTPCIQPTFSNIELTA